MSNYMHSNPECTAKNENTCLTRIVEVGGQIIRPLHNSYVSCLLPHYIFQHVLHCDFVVYDRI